MSAVITHIWTIAGSVDLTEATAQTVDELWKNTMDPAVKSAWQTISENEINDGVTERDNWLIILDKSARTMSRKREFVNIAEATTKKNWIDSNMSSFGDFTKTYTMADDDTALTQTGFITQ